MNESVVESGLDVANSKDVLLVVAWGGLRRSVVNNFLFFLLGFSALLCL